MAINPKPIDRELTQDEQFILNAFFEAKQDSAKAAICFDLRPWIFRYDNKFVLMLKCPEGPVGEMTLVNSLHEATQLFGKDLFDQTKDHFDPVTKACYQILLNEPCYIVRTFRSRKVVFTDEGVVPDEYKSHLTCPVCGKTNYDLYHNLSEVNRVNEIMMGQYYCCADHCCKCRGNLTPSVLTGADKGTGIFLIG